MLLSNIILSDLFLSDVVHSDERIPDVCLSDVRLSDVHLSEVRLSNVCLSNVHLSEACNLDLRWLISIIFHKTANFQPHSSLLINSYFDQFSSEL